MMGLRIGSAFLAIALAGAFDGTFRACLPADRQLPSFGKDTVLVWDIRNQEFKSQFVVRIAEFIPDRYLEWEDETTQGTIFLARRAITGAKGFVNARLFEGGVDTRSRDVTTLWLSERVFRDLKENKRVKVPLDSIDSWMTLVGTDKLTVEVNRAPFELPVVKIRDDRGSERWFLDSEENPLMLKHEIRKFIETLTSITTDRTNTLRWIKGKKLANPH